MDKYASYKSVSSPSFCHLCGDLCQGGCTEGQKLHYSVYSWEVFSTIIVMHAVNEEGAF